MEGGEEMEMEEGVGEKEEDEHQATAARLGMPVERLARPRLYVTRSAVLGGKVWVLSRKTLRPRGILRARLHSRITSANLVARGNMSKLHVHVRIFRLKRHGECIDVPAYSTVVTTTDHRHHTFTSLFAIDRVARCSAKL